MKKINRITFSIVSHGQATLIRQLLLDFAKLSEYNFEVIITINTPEEEHSYQDFKFPLRIIRNEVPKGFGANHNTAFCLCESTWYAVVNPDVRFDRLNLKELLAPFESPSVAAIAPLIFSGAGHIEDSARRFPTALRFFKRVILSQRAADYKIEIAPYEVDWLAGMFIVFSSDAYKYIGGFDDKRFYMYLEDADICRRLAKSGWKVMVNPEVRVVHMAQRASHRNFKHMLWHLISAFRFLTGL